VFLYRGVLAVEQLLPGFGAELLEAGAVALDTGDLAWLGEFGWNPASSRQFEVFSASRPLFEHLVLGRVRAMPGVEIRDGIRVESLRHGGPGGPPWLVDLADGSTEAADLVVDASGRASRLPLWLSAAGAGPVRTSEVDAHVGYATREYAGRSDRVKPAGIVLQQTPRTLAGGVALPVEGDRWLVGAIGSGDHRPPRDAAGFSDFLDALSDNALSEIIGTAQPLGDLAVHRQTANRRHHYEQLRDWPSGLLVMGDALLALNPIYGQGITVAACEALLLRRAIEQGLRPGVERRLLRGFCKIAALPWAIATGEDLRYPTCTGTGSPGQAMLHRWWQTIIGPDPVPKRWSPVQFSYAYCRWLQPCWGDRVPHRGDQARSVDMHGQGSAAPDVGELVNVVPCKGPALAGDDGPELPTVSF